MNGDDIKHHDWHDRAIDTALREVGGQRPPDLSARIMLALREHPQGDLPMLQKRQEPRASSRVTSFAMAAACVLLGLLLGVSLVHALRGPDGQKHTVSEQVEVRVLRGEVAFAAAVVDGRVGHDAPGSRPGSNADSYTAVTSRDRIQVFARTGTRIHASRAARVQVGFFPTLQVAADTELEVRSMEFSMKNGVVAASSLTIGVVVGMVSWSAWGNSGTAVAGETVELKAGQDQTTLAAENARLLARLTSLEQENGRLMTMRENAPKVAAPAAPDEPAVEEVAPPKPATASMFDAGQYADALKDVDWAKMGEATFAMQPLMNELVKVLEETGDVPPELAIKIQELNGNLLAGVPAMIKAGLPGTGPNGAYTHPLVVANTLASTLQAAGHALDPGQQAALDGLVKSFGAELHGVADGQYEFAGESLLREVEAKDRFYEEMSQRLTPEQFAAIYPKGSTEYDGLSLFGSGLLTRQFVKPIEAKSATEFARRAGTRIGDELGLNDAETKQLRAVIESSSAGVPELWQHPGSLAERKLNFLRKGRTMAAMRHQVSMMRQIVRTMNLSAEQKQKLMSFRGVLVPLPQQ